MELWSPPKQRIYVDMDGVMINSRDNTKRMEGKVGLVWSERGEDGYLFSDGQALHGNV